MKKKKKRRQFIKQKLHREADKRKNRAYDEYEKKEKTKTIYKTKVTSRSR